MIKTDVKRKLMLSAEVVIIGSGASAAHAAQTLVEQGHDVAIVDVGICPQDERTAAPQRSFLDLRTSDPEQYNYFLGPGLEAVTWAGTSVGAQLTAARRFIIEGVESLTPAELSGFNPYESLALGGLGGGWGAGCFRFSEVELAQAGLDKERINTSYEKVIQRIGVSQPGNDIRNYTLGASTDLQDPIHLNPLFQKMLQGYETNKPQFRKRGFYVGSPSLALLSRPQGTRFAHKYLDMDFYSDDDKSIYRPMWTVQSLIEQKKIRYYPKILITHVEESADGVNVHGRSTDSNEQIQLRAKKIILAAGVLGTSRIVLRSFPAAQELPLLCNSYSYYPSIYWPARKLPTLAKNLSLAQLMMFHDPDGLNMDVATASAYGYGSLMLFRLIKEAPLSIRSSRRLFQYLQKILVIFGVHHPDRPDGGIRSLSLLQDLNSVTGDRLKVEFYPKTDGIAEREREFKWAIRKLGCLPIKRVNPGSGSSIHYAGSLPFSQTERPFHLATSGRLHHTNNIYVADGSGVGFLPAKGITLTLMAIGDNTGRSVSETLKSGKT